MIQARFIQSVGQDHRARRHPWFRWAQTGQRAVMADAGYESRKLARELKRRHGWRLHFTKRQQRAFKVVGLTWIVERTFAWLSQKSSLEQRLRVEGPNFGSLHRPGGHPPHTKTARPGVKLLKHPLRARKKNRPGLCPCLGRERSHVPWQLNLRLRPSADFVLKRRWRLQVLRWRPLQALRWRPLQALCWRLLQALCWRLLQALRWRLLQALCWRLLQALLMSGADCLERVGCFVRTTSQLFVTGGPAGQKS